MAPPVTAAPRSLWGGWEKQGNRELNTFCLGDRMSGAAWQPRSASSRPRYLETEPHDGIHPRMRFIPPLLHVVGVLQEQGPSNSALVSSCWSVYTSRLVWCLRYLVGRSAQLVT